MAAWARVCKRAMGARWRGSEWRTLPPRGENKGFSSSRPGAILRARFFPHTEIIPPPPPSGLGNMGAYSWAGRIIHTQGEIFPGKNRADSLALCAPVRSQDTDAYHGRGLRTQNAYR